MKQYPEIKKALHTLLESEHDLARRAAIACFLADFEAKEAGKFLFQAGIREEWVAFVEEYIVRQNISYFKFDSIYTEAVNSVDSDLRRILGQELSEQYDRAIESVTFHQIDKLYDCHN